MQWIAPSEKDTGPETLENRLWAAADELRANSGLTSAQYSQPATLNGLTSNLLCPYIAAASGTPTKASSSLLEKI